MSYELLTEDDPFVKLFWQQILADEKARGEGRGPKESLYDSEATECRRRLYYALSGEPDERPPEPEQLWTMRTGDHMQNAFEDVLRSAGLLITKELRVPTESSRGRVDDIILFDGFKVVEVKSIHTEKAHYLSTKPDEKHLAQLNRYLGKLRLPTGYLAYIIRDGKKKGVQRPVFFYKVQFDAALFMAHELRLEEVRAKFASKTLPRRDYPKTDWHCEYCPFMKTCWERDAKLDGA